VMNHTDEETGMLENICDVLLSIWQLYPHKEGDRDPNTVRN